MTAFFLFWDFNDFYCQHAPAEQKTEFLVEKLTEIQSNGDRNRGAGVGPFFPNGYDDKVNLSWQPRRVKFPI